MTDQKQTALNLYLSGNTQKHIAQTVGVSEKTIYLWIRQNEWQQLRKAALQAPVIIVNNLYNQLIELQNTIAGREEGSRYPNLHEAEITRKLVNAIVKLKDYPSLGTTIQSITAFSQHLQTVDPELNKQVVTHADNFIRSKTKNGYRPYEIEYETPVTEKQGQEPVETKPSDNIHDTHKEPLALPESKFPDSPEIPAVQPAQTIDGKASQPSKPLTKPIPQPVKTGNEPTHIPGYNLAKTLAQVKRR